MRADLYSALQVPPTGEVLHLYGTGIVSASHPTESTAYDRSFISRGPGAIAIIAIQANAQST